MSAAKSAYKIGKQMRKEAAKLAKSGSKQSLWSKVGGAIGGAIAIGLTGGAAAPLVAAAIASGGTAIGGILGRQAGKSMKGGNYQGGQFYQDEAFDLKKQVNDQIMMSSLKAGGNVLGGTILSQVGGKISLGKGGVNIAADVGGGGKLNVSDMFKAGESAHEYSDTLFGNIGKAMDIKGSFGAKALASGKDFAGDLSTGFKNTSFDQTTLPEGMSFKDYQSLISEREGLFANANAEYSSINSGKAMTSLSGDSLNMMSVGNAPSSIGSNIPNLEDLFLDTPAPQGIADADVMRAKLNETMLNPTEMTPKSSLMQEIVANVDPIQAVDSIALPENILNPVNPNEVGAMNTIAKMKEQGYEVGAGGVLPKEFGEGFVASDGSIVSQTGRSAALEKAYASVPGADSELMDIDNLSFPAEPNYVRMDNQNQFNELRPIKPNIPGADSGIFDGSARIMSGKIQDPGFMEIGQESWKQGQEILNRIDAQKLNELESTSRFYSPQQSAWSKRLFGE